MTCLKLEEEKNLFAWTLINYFTHDKSVHINVLQDTTVNTKGILKVQSTRVINRMHDYIYYHEYMVDDVNTGPSIFTIA